MTVAASAALKMIGVTKRFGASVLANNNVNFDVRKGEVHALLGENGAGKSTLMNILYGLYEPTSGHIEIDGTPVTFANPSEAISHGLGMIHQEFMLVETFTVAENLVMGTTQLPDGVTSIESARAKIKKISKQFGLDVNPDAVIETLSVGERQRVEILKLLFRDARILILDEPTAVLTPQETESFFTVLEGLRDSGCSIVIVTHKMQEVMAISNRVSVMRAGELVATVNTEETNPAALIRLMVGREVDIQLERASDVERKRSLELIGLEVPRRSGAKTSPPVSLSVFSGEVLGIAGVDGNGQTELFEAIMGLRDSEAGSLVVNGKVVSSPKCFDRRKLGLSYVPPDRRGFGSLVTESIAQNVMLASGTAFSKFGMVNRGALHTAADVLMKRFGVRAPDPNFIAGNLSGGNLQKVILGREVSKAPQVLLIEQPTRGLDVGAIELVWGEIMAQRNLGVPILLASTELEEIMALSDRIAVMFEGEIMGIVPRAEATSELLGALMVGTPLEDYQHMERAS